MLEYLHIENVALVEKADINFNNGLNILSGETGAGKSMIVDAINFVFGNRVSKDFINRRAENAIVEALLYIKKDNALSNIKNMGISLGDDNKLFISRTISRSGKNICRINGKMITVGMLKEISDSLIDIHGQHEHQSLLNQSKHIVLLDKFCEEEIDIFKAALTEKYKEYKNILQNINEISTNINGKNSKIELYQFQIDEIVNADLKDNEEQELIARKKVLCNSEKLKNYCNEALEFLYRSEYGSASDRISQALDSIYGITSMDESKQEICDELVEISVKLDDVISELRRYSDNIEYNSSEIEAIEKRLTILYNLKQKYGPTVHDILKYCNSISEKLDCLLNSEKKLHEFEEKKKSLEISIKKICKAMSDKRKICASNIENRVESILNELGMKQAKFKIDIVQKLGFNTNGWDSVQFLISPNPGEKLKPLEKIASGGEMSRIMLALKAVLSDADTIETFIFDEIDTGVSGRTAQQVAQKLSDIGKNYQIICITHLPQIAAMADNHLFIEKKSIENNTKTMVSILDYNGSVTELARLIGGAEITDFTLKAAEEMKQMAIRLKRV